MDVTKTVIESTNRNEQAKKVTMRNTELCNFAMAPSLLRSYFFYSFFMLIYYVFRGN